MKRKLQFGLGFALAIVFSGIGYSQNDRVPTSTGDVYLISAKAGGVSHVEGSVSVARKDGKSGLLIKGDQLEVGDRVATGADSRSEILLNPGSFLRLGGNSVFEFETTSLDDLKLKIEKGSAVLEILASDDFTVSLQLPNANLKFTRSGVFRVDVLGDGSGRISVWKGKLSVGGGTEIGSGRSAVIKGNTSSVAKFDRDNLDDLDMWSKLRAKEIASVNARLQRDSMRNSLLNSYNNGRWNTYGSFGVWVFDPYRRMWCFMPFGYGWNSPYGYDNPFNMWYCRMPYWVYNNSTGGGSTGGGNGGGTGGGTGGGANQPVTNPTRADRQERSITPPFQRTNPDGNRSERRENPNVVIGGGGNREERRNDDTYEPRGNAPRSRDTGPVFTPNTDSKPVYTPPIVVTPNPKSEKDN